MTAPEDARFAAAIAKSTPPVKAVAEYLRRRGCQVEILAPEEFVDPELFKDRGADLRCRKLILWRKIEVKGRKFDFISADDFPYATIFIDRANKDQTSDFYVSVSKSLTHAAVVSRASEEHWTQATVFDSDKGYYVTVFQCSTEYAKFIAL